MNELFSGSAPAADWERLRPVIDDALDALGERDREAVLLRFFEGRALADVGAKLSVSEDAARMRVERALEKMRALLARQGITSTTAVLGATLANQAGAAAPLGLAASVTGAALAGATVGGSSGAWISFFAMSKIKIGIVCAIVATIAVTGVVELRANRGLRAEIETLQAAHRDAGELPQQNRPPNAPLQMIAGKNPEADELLRLRARVALLKVRPDGVTDELMKLMSVCQNVGRATPAASLETGLWAARVGDTDTLMNGYFFTDEMKAGLASFFASQSEVVRSRYGSPERLLGELWKVQADELPAAFRIVDEKRSFKTEADAAALQVWCRLASGEERMTKMFLQRGASGWGIVMGNYPEAQWAKLAARIDQATGALHPSVK